MEVSNLLGGMHRAAIDGGVRERRDPGDRRRLVAVSPDSGARDVEAALDSAAAGSRAWARTPIACRLELLEGALRLLESDAEGLAYLTVLESGKTLEECRGEVIRAIATVRYQLGVASAVATDDFGITDGVAARVDRVPVGIAAVITPWNFPFSALLRKIVPALAMGNAVVAKPSELSPLAAFRIGQALVQAGLPEGVISILHGGGTAGAALVNDARVGAVSFTGSTEVGLGIARQTAGREVKVQLEMGGKNPLVILSDADIDRAIEHAVAGAFTAAGQWCVAASRVIVEEPTAHAVASRLAERAAAIRVGHGLDPASQMGALVSPEHFAKVERALALAAHDATVLVGGEPIHTGGREHGEFIAPTVLSDVAAGSSLLRDEIFGPVVTVESADSLEHAIELAGSSGYGLSASVYTSSRASADAFVAGVTSGKVSINRPPNHGDARVPSGGRRASGRGEGEGGKAGLCFYSYDRAVFVDGGESGLR